VEIEHNEDNEKLMKTMMAVAACALAIGLAGCNSSADDAEGKMRDDMKIWWRDAGHEFVVMHSGLGAVNLFIDGNLAKTFSDYDPAVSYVKHTYGGTNVPRRWKSYLVCSIGRRDDGVLMVYFEHDPTQWCKDIVSGARYIDGSQWLRDAASNYNPVYLSWKDNGYVFGAQEDVDGSYLLLVNEQPTTLHFSSFTEAVSYAKANYR
jgi:hypothetical protein